MVVIDRFHCIISEHQIEGQTVENTIVKMVPTAILDLKVRTNTNHKTDIKIELSGPKYPINHKSNSIVGQNVENVIFKMATHRYNGFWAPKNCAHPFQMEGLVSLQR